MARSLGTNFLPSVLEVIDAAAGMGIQTDQMCPQVDGVVLLRTLVMRERAIVTRRWHLATPTEVVRYGYK